MKTAYYILMLCFLALTACSSHETPKDVPFEMMPDGLKKSIEAELIESIEKDVIEYHVKMDSFYSFALIPACGWIDNQNVLKIDRNFHSKIMVRDEIASKERLQAYVKQFYLANEGLTAKQTAKYIYDRDYEFVGFPFYSTVTKEDIERKIKENEEELNKAVQEENDDFIFFYQDRLEKWKTKKQVIETLGSKELKEIHPQTQIRIVDKLNMEGLSPMTTEAIKGLIQVRDYASRKYFGMSYMDLYFQGTRFLQPDSEKKLTAIDHLFPTSIVDLSYARLNNLWTSWEIEEPPMMEE
ncbi:MAG: hypothetical protein NXI10_08200 [bacterium]|nr:hypothetical protein [bacterium]